MIGVQRQASEAQVVISRKLKGALPILDTTKVFFVEETLGRTKIRLSKEEIEMLVYKKWLY